MGLSTPGALAAERQPCLAATTFGGVSSSFPGRGRSHHDALVERCQPGVVRVVIDGIFDFKNASEMIRKE